MARPGAGTIAPTLWHSYPGFSAVCSKQGTEVTNGGTHVGAVAVLVFCCFRSVPSQEQDLRIPYQKPGTGHGWGMEQEWVQPGKSPVGCFKEARENGMQLTSDSFS